MQNIFSVNICCVETTIFTNCSPISLRVILRRASLFSAVYVYSYVKAYGHTTSVHFTLNNVSLKFVFDTGKQNSTRLFQVSSLNESLTELNKENFYRENIIVHQLLQIILVLHLHSKVI